jgi:hypothetical protein
MIARLQSHFSPCDLNFGFWRILPVGHRSDETCFASQPRFITGPYASSQALLRGAPESTPQEAEGREAAATGSGG